MSDHDEKLTEFERVLATERDAARADLAAANVRIAKVRCACGCTWDNHEDAGVRCTSHESCLGFRADPGEGWASYAAEQEHNARLRERNSELSQIGQGFLAERDRLQARIDKALALAKEWEAEHSAEFGEPLASNHPSSKVTNLRAALNDVDPCHCGEPVTYGFDGDPTHHRGMCERCDAVRCDACPGACKRRNA